ncbi:hypothetical protein SUGI_0092000 [Cryptomeria japonica]|nr:hypothetical protein SUGI_0092000 [Cryptomeria japonica]
MNIGHGYRLTSIVKDSKGNLFGQLQLINKTEIYGSDLEELQLVVSYETEDRLHLSITDAQKPRWEVPQELLPRERATFLSQKTSNNSFANGGETGQPESDHHHELQFSYTTNPFGFSIMRKSSGEVLFNTTDEGPNSLVFKDQFIQISTRVPPGASLYGLGESSRPGGFKLVRGDTYTLWNSDIPSSNAYLNLYGSHPFYMDVRQGGTAHGVLFLNSNGMDIEYAGDRVKYKIIGGIIDFYFFSGPSPTSVIQQYTKLIGRPAPMPYWSFGFHQCRWGYKDVSDLETVVSGYREKDIPLDAIWNDIDYMEDFKDFTLDPVNYPAAKLRPFMDQLHASGQKYVLIVDPGIKIEKGYDTFDHAVKEDIFIKQDGQPYLAQVWPGPVHFPDFLNPKTQQFWTKEISQFLETVPVDGLWIDMNEVSNFCSGVTCSLPENRMCPMKGKPITDCCLVCSSPPNSTKWEDPPYKIRNNGNHRHIRDKTITPSALHANGILEYNAHNLYGLSETIVTNRALKSIRKKRPFILTRSTFVGSGAYAAHWTGDNAATWDDLKYSIPSILNFGLFGMPMVGADICGFLKDTTEELCNRWIQLGAFYPFSRQHSDNGTIRQELYLWDSVSVSSRRALALRYELLPYLYTLSFEAHLTGNPIARPMFFTFPDDPITLNRSTQYLLGKGILISPVLDQGATSLNAYFPRGTWYNLFDFSHVISPKNGSFKVLEAPIDTINVHMVEGIILPMQEGGLTTIEARKTPFTLLISFPMNYDQHFNDSDEQYHAKGDLFLDNGEDIEMHIEENRSTYVEFHAYVVRNRVEVISEVKCGEYALQQEWKLQRIVVLGSSSRPQNLTINGFPSTVVAIHNTSTSLTIGDLHLNIGERFKIWWEIMFNI